MTRNELGQVARLGFALALVHTGGFLTSLGEGAAHIFRNAELTRRERERAQRLSAADQAWLSMSADEQPRDAQR